MPGYSAGRPTRAVTAPAMALVHWRHGPLDHDRGGRPPLVPARRGRPRPPRVHARRGRVGAVAKGVRKTKSRFGARLEPFSHVELVLHQGRGELDTVTGASLVRSHDRIRSDPYRLQVGMIGLEAMLRLFTEQEANEKAFTALTRFLDALDEARAAGLARRARSRGALVPAEAALGVRLHAPSRDLRRVRGGGAARRVPPGAGGGACAACDPGGIPLSPEGVRGIACCSIRRSPLPASAGLGDRARARRSRS